MAPICSCKGTLALTEQDRYPIFRSQLCSRFPSYRYITSYLIRSWVMTWLVRLARHTTFAPSILVFSRRPGRYKEVTTILWIWTCIFWVIIAWLMLQASFGVLNVFAIMSHVLLGLSFRFWVQPSLRFMSHASRGQLLQFMRVEAIITMASDRWINVRHSGLFSSFELGEV